MKKDSIDNLVLLATKGSKEAQTKLLERLKPLILKSIQKYSYRKNDIEDKLQAANLEILLALLDFDPKKGVPFLGYIKQRLRFFILNLNREREHSSLNEVCEDTKTERLELLEDETNIEHEYEKKVLYQELYNAIDKLPKAQRISIIDYYFNDMSIGDIANKYNKSYRTILNNKQIALKKLKEMLKNEY